MGAQDRALEAYEQARENQLSDTDNWFKLGMMLYDGENYPILPVLLPSAASLWYSISSGRTRCTFSR